MTGLIVCTLIWTPSIDIERTYWKAYAYTQVGPHQGTCLDKLWHKESRWNPTAKNRNSTARGIPQLLGLPKHLTPYQQIDRGLKYIEARYHGQPCQAWTHFKKRGWY